VYGQTPASTYDERQIVKNEQLLLRNETEEQPIDLQAFKEIESAIPPSS
tara:strand:- start:419 stop:565 length:147 start_codon:yes stop_codon:yes gene_type:complete